MWPVASPPSSKHSAGEPAVVFFDVGSVPLRNGWDRSARTEASRKFDLDWTEGRWTVFEAIDLDVEAPVIAISLMRRIDSRDAFDYSDRLLSAMRTQFGGHAVRGTGD